MNSPKVPGAFGDEGSPARVQYEIAPEPSDEERKALLTALERLLRDGDAEPAAYRSAWRQAGVVENLEDDYATARPRRSRGATRA